MGVVFDNTEDDKILDRMLAMANAIDDKVGTYEIKDISEQEKQV